MDSNNQALAERELNFVIDQLTDAELMALDQLVVKGDLYGMAYVAFHYPSCGYVFGSIGLMRGALTPESECEAGVAFRNQLLGEHVAEFTTDDSAPMLFAGDHTFTTALEDEIRFMTRLREHHPSCGGG